MTAEAENTITRPRNTNSIVTVNSHRSTLTRFAMGHLFHHGAVMRLLIVDCFGSGGVSSPQRHGDTLRMVRGSQICGRQCGDDVLENLPSVLVVLELVEAGARGCEQDYVALLGCRMGFANGILQGFGVH